MAARQKMISAKLRTRRSNYTGSIPNIEKVINLNSRISQPAGDDRPRVTLVGLFPLHKGADCTEIVSVKNYNGYQRMEAFVMALEKVNDHVYNSDVFIETILYDTCSDSLAEYVSYPHCRTPTNIFLSANKSPPTCNQDD